MMLPDFKIWLGALCMYYSKPDWPTERVTADVYRDVRNIPQEHLEAIGQYIRCTYEYWPRSLSSAMHKAHAQVLADINRAEKEKTEAQLRQQRPDPSPQDKAQSQRRCRELLEGLATGLKPPWAGQKRAECGYPGAGPYHRGK